MSRAETLAAVTAGRLLPVIVLEREAAAAPLAEALVAGGLRCAEGRQAASGSRAGSCACGPLHSSGPCRASAR